MSRTMTEIGKAIDKEAKKARKGYIINYLHRMDITHHAGTRLEDMNLQELESVYIAARCDVGRAYAE